MERDAQIIDRMELLIRQWEQADDRRSIFLACYALMTRNMWVALEKGEFINPTWVRQLLARFAEYYFEALESYERSQELSPATWNLVFEAANDGRVHALQHLILGVNAHINYDLTLALADVLQDEWAGLDPEQRQRRYRDHCRVNDIIESTIDEVQDTILERYAPAMDWVDRSLGRLDEWIISRLISRWRDGVWEQAVKRLEVGTEAERELLRQEIEVLCLQRGRLILLEWKGRDWGKIF